MLINKHKNAVLKHFNDSKEYLNAEYPNDKDDIYKNIAENNPNKKHKTLIIFDNVIANMLSNKKLNLIIISELFIRGRKLNISLVFIMQSYFAVPKNY